MKDGGSAFPVYGERRFGECGEFSGGDEDVTDFGGPKCGTLKLEAEK